MSGIPSKLVLYAPRYNTTFRKTRLFHDIAMHMGTIINILEDGKQEIKEENEKRHTLRCYNQYTKILTRLKNILYPKKINNSKQVNNSKQINNSKQNGLNNLLAINNELNNINVNEMPISDVVLNPKAEPLNVSNLDLLKPLYDFLQDEKSVIDNENQKFKKGTICTDGRLDLCKQVIGMKGIDGLIKSLEVDSNLIKPKVRHLLLGNNLCGNTLGEAIGRFISSGK